MNKRGYQVYFSGKANWVKETSREGASRREKRIEVTYVDPVIFCKNEGKKKEVC